MNEEITERPVTVLALKPDHGRADPARPAQQAHIYRLAASNVFMFVRCSDGKPRSVVLDTDDVDAVCEALQQAATAAREEWRETFARSEAYAAIERERTA